MTLQPDGAALHEKFGVYVAAVAKREGKNCFSIAKRDEANTCRVELVQLKNVLRVNAKGLSSLRRRVFIVEEQGAVGLGDQFIRS